MYKTKQINLPLNQNNLSCNITMDPNLYLENYRYGYFFDVKNMRIF